MKRNLKQSMRQYRNIKGKYFEMWTADTSEFEAEIKEAKKMRLSHRIINKQMYREKK